MRILLAPNSFKECALSTTVVNLLSYELKNRLPDYCNIIEKPLSDGGDGFWDICKNYFGLSRFAKLTIPDCKNEKEIEIEAALDKTGRNVFLESAQIFGLKLVPPEKRNPKFLSSVGLGFALRKIASSFKNVSDIFIGLGGTAINDLGAGALHSLGLEFLDQNNRAFFPFPIEYAKIRKLDYAGIIHLPKLHFIIDVDNPLMGENGATRIYGQQKGITPDDFGLYDRFFEKIMKHSKNKIPPDLLSGAGGGVAAGFKLFYDVEIISSETFILEHLGINSSLKPDILITGEGQLDGQTFEGKGIGVLIKEFDDARLFIICGKSCVKIENKKIKVIELEKYFDSTEESISNFERGICKAAEEIADDILFNQKVD